MIRHYVLYSEINLQGKGYSLANFIGMTPGLGSLIVIYLWVINEFSYDSFHINNENIYRVEQDFDYDGDLYHINVTPYLAAQIWKSEIPEIENSVRIAFP